MLENIDFVLWLTGAVIVVGIIQWAKNLFKTAPAWAWYLALPLVSLVAGIARGGELWAWNALGFWATSQLGYEIIVQGFIGWMRAKVASTPASAAPPEPQAQDPGEGGMA